MKILFIGSTKRGYLTLKSLISNNENIVGVISLQQFFNEVENYEFQIRELASEFKIKIFETKNLNGVDWERIITEDIDPDITLVVGCRVLIPTHIYKIPRYGTLAVHDSLIPDYRGFAPLNWAIINGEQYSGVTLFYISDDMDGGDIVGQKKIKISPIDSALTLYEKVCDLTCELIIETIPLLKGNSAPKIQQDYSAGSFCCSRSPNDGMINWYEKSHNIFNMIRALSYPYPGAFTYYQGNKIIIEEATLPVNQPNYKGRIPGRVIKIDKLNGHVDVLTCDGILRIHTIQINGVRYPASSQIKSVRETLGIDHVEILEKLQTLEKKIQVLEKYLPENLQ